MNNQPSTYFLLCLSITLFLVLNPAASHAQHSLDSSYFYYQSIVFPKTPEDIPRGIAFYTNRATLSLDQKDTLKAIESLRLIASGYFKIGNYYDSEEAATHALSLLRSYKHKDSAGNARIGIYNQLGLLYRNLENPQAALALYDSALSASPSPTERNILLNNKANLLKDLGKYADALEEYKSIAQTHNESTGPILRARVLDNIGAVMAKMNLPSSRDTLLKALAIREAQTDLSGLYSSYKNLALYYHDRKGADSALAFAKQAQQTATRLNSASFRYDALELLALLHSDPDITEYRRLTDSLARARQLAENKNAFIKYNIGEERKKTAVQALQKERAQRSKQLFQLSTAGILLLLILSYFVFRYRYKKGRQEEMYRTESRISKKVHDELANDLFHALAYAEAHPLQEPEEKEKLLTSLDRLYTRTRDISKDTAPIPTGPDFPNYLRELLAGFSTDKVNVILNGLESLPWVRISDLKKMACFRILQELLVNMKKHSGATLVLLSFAREGKYIRIHYSDNGRGIAPGAHVERGGLRITENRMAAIKGTFTFENQASGGFRCQLRFPL